VLGIYRFISEGGALINVIGNGVATLFVAKWEGALDLDTLAAELKSGSVSEPQGAVLKETV
jgi:aerobic C4-dicarboxylate transport protein